MSAKVNKITKPFKTPQNPHLPMPKYPFNYKQCPKKLFL